MKIVLLMSDEGKQNVLELKITLLKKQPRFWSSMTNTSIVIGAIDWIIPFHRNLLSSAFVLASFTFIVSACWCCWSNHGFPWFPHSPCLIATLYI